MDLDKLLNNFDLSEYSSLDREYFVENIVNLLGQNTYRQICLNSEWGSGKTVFVKQVISFLEDMNNDKKENGEDLFKETVNIYFDTWKYENYSDPILALLSYINRKTKNLIKDTFEKEDYIFDFSLDFGSLSPISINMTKDKNLTSDYLNTLYLEEQSFHIFNTLITKITNEKDIRINIFVDELDRCKPGFAMKLLEVFHHFDNENVCFIYSTDKEQLECLVKHHYGTEYNSNVFFDKIFDFEILLSRISYEEKNKYTKGKLQKCQGRIWSAAYLLLSTLDVSLRDINTISSELDRFSQSNTAYKFLDGYYTYENDLYDSLGFEYINIFTHLIILRHTINLDIYNMDKIENAQIFCEKVEPMIQKYSNTYKDLIDFYSSVFKENNYRIEDNILVHIIVDMFQTIKSRDHFLVKEYFTF